MSKSGVKIILKVSFNGDLEVTYYILPSPKLFKLMIEISLLPSTEDAGKLLVTRFLFFPS